MFILICIWCGIGLNACAPMDIEPLIELARQARKQAYAPYSRFAVGAALLGKNGHVFTGCNVENLSFGLSICAERNAVFAAAAQGFREFQAIAIVADADEAISPCGACRQVLAEFSPGMEIITANLNGKIFRSTLAELLPRAKTGILNQ
jgi:cytidine deaminase